jgi:hypothetical protein
MPSLEPEKVSHLKTCLSVCKDPILLAGISDCEQPSKALRGAIGVIDWRLHGTVSKLLIRNAIDAFTLVPHNRLLADASLLLMRTDGKLNLDSLFKTLKRMQINRICIAESTFSDQIFNGIQQQLKKADVTWTKLEDLA